MTRIAVPALALLLASFSGCAAPGGAGAQTARETERKQGQESSPMKQSKKTWVKEPCTGIAHLAEFNNLSADDLEAQLGAPKKKESFRRGERQDEFHILLENTYPVKKAENKEVPLQEWTWTE